MGQRFLSDVHATAGLKDSSGDLGSNGQVLSSTGSNTNWVNPTVGTTVIYKDAFTATNGQTAFTLANTVDSEDKTQVYIDGAYQSKGGYAVSGTTLTFDTGLATSSAVEVITFSTATANNAATAVKLDTFTGDGSDLTFVLNEAVVDEKVTQVYINGVYQNKSTYSIAADLVTLTFGSGNAPPNYSTIEVISFKTITSTDGTFTATTFLGDLNGTINTATTATTQSAGNNSTKVATTAYADAKVADAINNGTTAIAPSQNAVFDALALKANLAGPTFTGTPAAPTASAGTNTTQLATTAFVTTGIANIVDSAPGTLNTLNELAAALGDDVNFSTTVTNSIATKAPLASPTFTGNATFNLDGDSSLLLSDGGTNASVIKSGSGDELYIGANNTYALRFLADGTNNVVFDNNSKVDITTSVSGFASTITNNKDDSQGLLVRTSDNDGSEYILDLQSSSSATGTNYASKFNVAKSGNATFAGSIDVGTFTISGSGIIADSTMTLQVNGGTTNALTIASGGETTVTAINNSDTLNVKNTGTYGGTIAFTQGSSTNVGYVGSIRALEGNGSASNGIGLFSRDRISFYTDSSTPDVTISSTGNLGIGISAAGAKLEVVAQSDTVGGDGIILGNGSNREWMTRFGTNTDLSYNLDFYDGSSWANKLKLTYTGNLGIGEPNPHRKLNVASGTNGDGIYISGLGTSMSTNDYRSIEFAYSDTDTSYGSAIHFEVPNAASHGGQMSFFTDNTSGTLTKQLTISSGGTFGFASATDAGVRMMINSMGTTSSTYAMILRTANGASNIAYFNDARDCYIYGGLGVGGTKSFKIDHPLESKKDTHSLVHSCVESPEINNLYRGKVDLVNGTAMINLDTVSHMTEGTFVVLNDNIQCFTTNESDWDAVKGSVNGNILTISCQNSSSNANVSWMIIAERKDNAIINSSTTDSNGKLIVEPLKTNEP